MPIAERLYQFTENSVLKAEYIYNDMGQRTKKTLYQADGITVDSITIYHYDQMGHLITETDLQGNLIKDYVWSNQMMPMAQIDAVIPAQAGIQPIESITYLYTDHLMTNRLATSQSKTIIWRWEGEAFGNTQAQELAGVSINLRFPGQYYDSETNLHYNWNRYYDPSIGRYITSDPIGINGGMNTYLYAGANPIRFMDIFGLDRFRGKGGIPEPWENAVYPAIDSCSFVYDCLDNYRDNSPIGIPISPKGIVRAIAEKAARILMCETQNACQCLGTAEGGCPGKPGWLPFPPDGSLGPENNNENNSDSDEGGSCEPFPLDEPNYPFPDWSSPRSECKWDFSQDPPVAICP